MFLISNNAGTSTGVPTDAIDTLFKIILSGGNYTDEMKNEWNFSDSELTKSAMLLSEKSLLKEWDNKLDARWDKC